MGINLSWPKGNPHGGSKLTDEALIELHFHGLSIRKLAEQLARFIHERHVKVGSGSFCLA